jgi:tetratricopeptide (TPR) repeat protein
MKTGRNDPCPCGSGKKYKKCCLNAVSPIETNSRFFYSDLDKLSNRVPDLIKQEKYKEAEEVCQRLLKENPEQIDGLHRFAELFEAKGEFRQAAEYYLKSAEFAKQADGFEQESIDNFMQKSEELSKNADQ